MIKVVWVCSVSNPELRKHLDLGRPWWHRLIRKLLKREQDDIRVDTAQWNTNAIREFESIDEVDLHVIFVHPYMRKRIQRFNKGNINFYAVSEWDDTLIHFLKMHLGKGTPPFEKTWMTIAALVEDIKPDIIHIMGAENPPYSLSINLLPHTIPTILQLQTVLNDPVIVKSYPSLIKQRDCEKKVINRACYLGTKSANLPSLVREYIKRNVIVLNLSLLLEEKVNLEPCTKSFDFVYFANNISKAIDLAVEAFGIAYKKNPKITLDVIGEVSEVERNYLNSRLNELKISNAVYIEGKLPTHNDVINQIRKARFALLPLKTDYVSGTIREAISNGLPVITTITNGTPVLNEQRDSVLLSKIGNHEELAENMLRLLDDNQLAERLKNNAILTVEERYGNNRQRALGWVEAYQACIAHFNNGTPIPEHILNKN